MKADMHIHTEMSDGRTKLEDLVDIALEAGLGCIAVTDHNTVAAYDILKDDERIIVVPGVEITSSEGHILAYGITEDIPKGMSVLDTVNAIHGKGGLAFVPHPYRMWSGIGEKNIIPEFDGLEALNRRSPKASNLRSLKLARSVGKPIVAGSDSHTPDTVGKGYIVIPDSCRTWQDVMAAIMNMEAVPFSGHRGIVKTVKYGTKSITKWALRGFRRL
ncbi:MAG: CehA/McbA family metallohydrolase [Candidatus Thermoplasmatota archaeon]|jgi:predicted metal-dependent phosphoesterase TrpH|nr:metal-dependent phosphoesterase [Methanomassiliicoccales archaeon RumEn M2]MDI9378241.1 CehA/McbA family metallohydrolase [Candidatus Thermoplasmatota archaeon]